MTQSRFSYRVLTSFFVTFYFLILLVTGVELYVVPHGRVANWINSELIASKNVYASQWSIQTGELGSAEG